MAQAVGLRKRMAVASDGVRLVHGEADGLPGLVVDRYADTLSAQFLFAGCERWKDVIADALLSATGATRLYERSDTSVRALEGLPVHSGWLRGDGNTQLTIREHEWQLLVDVAKGHKTGFYLDQHDNRLLFAQAVRRYGCADVLNCYSYTGGFTLAALAGGAQRVASVDASAPALELARSMSRSTVSMLPDTRWWMATSMATCALAWKRASASMPSCWIRQSLRPPQRKQSAPQGPTRTSTAWH